MAKSTPGAVKAGGASVVINADSGPFNIDIEKVEKRLKAFGQTARAMGPSWGD